MSSKYRSRIKVRKRRKIGGSLVEKAPEVARKVQAVARKVPEVARKAQSVAKGVKKVGKATRKLAQGLSDNNVSHAKDMEDFRHRSLHSYHHAHSFVNNVSPHVLHAHRAVANILAGGGIHAFHGNIRPKDFHDYKYPVKVPKQAYKDLARSDRETLRNALEDEYHDHAAGRTGSGLFHALNSTAAAAAHWGRKQHSRGQTLHKRLKEHAPEHFDRLRKYTHHVKHGAEWVRDQIETNRSSFHETAGLFASSDIKPLSAVGEMMGSMDHHIDGVHSLTGEVSEYASKAHSVMGGSFKDNVKTGATVARKALRTGAKVAEVSAGPAMLLGATTGNTALLEYGELAPVAAEAARLAAYGLGQTTKLL